MPWPVLLMTRELGLGGTERQLAETALALDRNLFVPHVGCFRAGGFRCGELLQAGVPILELDVRSLVSSSMAAGARRMGSYLDRHGIQLVHAFDVPLDLFAVPVARFFRTPIVLSSQRAHRTLTPGITRHLLRLTDRMVDGIVVNSRAVERELLAEDGVPGPLIRLAHNGVDTGRFSPGGATAELPWSLPGSVIGTVCALRPEKGLESLLDAFAHTRRSHPGARLLIVGSGPQLPGLEERARSLALGGDCHFQPAVQNVAEWLRAMDVFVLPSLSEAFSNSLMEAMASGCCAVASDAGGNPELISHGETGFLFPAGDAAALADRLTQLLDDPARRRMLSQNALDLIARQFTREAAARRMGDIYRSYLQSL